MNTHRPDGALLAGVCAGIARPLGWNVWALRALFVVFLLIKTLWAVLAYAVLALAMWLLDRDASQRGGATGTQTESSGLESPELAERSRRIADLERRFHDLERREH